MLKLMEDGAVQECRLPGPAQAGGGTAYPVYHRDLHGGMLAANSFMDEVWFVEGGELLAHGRDAILSRLAQGPAPEALIREAALRTQRLKEAAPYELAFCPTYSCNLRCAYCYQQFDPTLDKRVVSDENLSKFLAYAGGMIDKVRAARPERPVVLQFFGGEPFTRPAKPVIKKLFEFCRERKVHVAVTTNGVGVDDFFDILLPYHGYIAKVGVTLDGVGEFHDSRRKSRDGRDTFDGIVRNINVLLRAGIRVMTSLTLDKSNLGQAERFFAFAEAQGWSDNPLVELSVARVDDRKYETGYDAIMSEARLFKELLDLNSRKPFPANIRFAFLKTSLPLAARLRSAFNQNEAGRDKFRYCWSCSGLDSMVYVDSGLDVYRCTYTVGDKRFRIGTLAGGFSTEEWEKHWTWGRRECRECPIGGYCSGGCRLSAQKDFERNCREEKANFEYLIEHVVAPKLAGMLPAKAA